MNIKLLAVALLLLFALYSCSDSSDNSLRLHNDATVLAFGDSLTFGTGSGKGEDYPSRLSELSNLQIINAGIPGEISSKGLQRLAEQLEIHKPALMILIHGGNDILRKLPRQELKNNLLTMIELAKNHNTDVVMFGVPEPGLFLKSAEIYEQVAEQANIPIELKLLPEILGEKSLKSDIAHPNAKGYEKMANGIFAFLQDQGFI